MNELVRIIKKLIGSNDISSISSDNIVENICLHLYEKENSIVREARVFDNLPIVIRDIILIIDFDTEMNMNGILGFLENPTGLFLDDTIAALERINANEDCTILKRIKGILLKNQLDSQKLRDNVNSLNQYEITNFIKTHGYKYESMANEIATEGKQFYLYKKDRYIFDNLIKYVDVNKTALIKYLQE